MSSGGTAVISPMRSSALLVLASLGLGLIAPRIVECGFGVLGWGSNSTCEGREVGVAS